MKFSAQAVYDWYRQVIRNPKYRWWIILGTVAYLISPIDIAPDFIPFIGQVDDVVLLTLLISEVSQMLTERLRRAKGQPTDTPTVADASQPQTADETVDVNAIPMN